MPRVIAGVPAIVLLISPAYTRGLNFKVGP